MSVVPEIRPGSGERRTPPDDRRSRALAALRAAEHGLDRRPRSATGPDIGPDAGPVPAARDASAEAPPLRPVHPALAPLLPGGELPSGGVLTVQGSTSLLLTLLATTSRDGAWVAFVGAPAVGMLAADDAGISLERTAVVPDPGPDAPAVLAALLDGMDVVVVGPRTALLPADRRRLAARTRQRGAVLVSTGHWPGAHVVLDARGGAWAGTDAGAGWLRRRTLSVLRTGRGSAARPVEIDVEVPVCGDVLPPSPPGPAAGREHRLRVA